LERVEEISKTGNVAGSISFGPLALVSGLVAGFCYSLYYTAGKYLSKKYSSAYLFLYVLPMGALGIFPFVDFSEKNIMAWMALIGVAVVSTFVANYCYYNGLKYLEAGRASIVATVEPVVAATAAYLLLGEYFTPLGSLGAGLILIAVIATICEKRVVIPVNVELSHRGSMTVQKSVDAQHSV